MKYNNLNQNIPQEQRKQINEKILYCIDNKLCDKYGLTNEVIYNSYTGDGGLHGLNFNNYNSFHSYTKAKQEIENGQFFTGVQESQYLVNMLNISEYETVLDLTCGSGSLFNFLPNEYNIYGNEIDIKAYKISKHLYPLANITHGDMREYNPHMIFDTIIGNPPFNLRLRYKNQELYSQMIYIQRSCELLKNGGLLALIVPKSFLDDEFINKSDIEYVDKNFNFIGQILLDHKAFKYLGIDNFETKIILFSKKSEFIPSNPYSNEFISGDSNFIYNNYIKPIRDLQGKYKSSIKLENLRQYTDEDKIFNDKVTKMLFDIKRTKSIQLKYTECYNYYQLYYNQKKPESLNMDEWLKIMVTKETVFKKLKTVLKNQHLKDEDKVELVKTNYHIKLKGYSDNTRKYVQNVKNNIVGINDLVLSGYSFEDNKYKKIIDKKKREFEYQSIKFDDMKLDESINKWLQEKYLYDYIKEEEIRLTDKQRFDINKILQKKYGYNQWSTGSGKSLSSLFYALYRLEFNHVKNIIVVAPAIAIKNTYVDMLETYRVNYRIINSIEDINNIQDGEFLLFTFNMLIKLQRQVKKIIKINNKRFALMVDEADGISNTMSKRCKASLNCFRRLPYKLLMSGTSTRNSINEIYTQLELLYNNSINMISTNEYIYKIDDDTKELKKTNNDIYMRPFPPYRKGYEYFNNSFIPKKITVFGMAKFNQDILNKDNLKQLIDKTIITRTLKDITGRDLTEPHQVTCKFNDAEYSLYKTILEEFYSMSAEYQIHTGNSRKDSMFRILAQLNTLLKACSTPHAFKEYNGNTISSKFLKVFELIDGFNERVVIGCTRVKTVDLYYSELLKRYPNRKVFRITGKDTTLKQRKDLVNQMKENGDCIVIATQQSLSCSMNIGFVDKVIITEMLWNESSMQQFKARFSRMNSDNITDIYNVFYEKSIEVNLLKLNMAKEKLCMFMKNEDIDEEELYEQFGIDSWMLNSLMVKEKNEDGSIIITWGDQEIN